MEKVLAFPTRVLADACGGTPFQGAMRVAEASDLLKVVLSPENLYYVPRDQAEKDPAWKQVIPYVAIRSSGLYLRYLRTPKGGEGRLHGRSSIGLGGHINPVDGDSSLAYSMGFHRELFEEAGLLFKKDNCWESLVGCINDDSDEVGKVHFGVVHAVALNPDQRPRAKDPAVQLCLYSGLEKLKEDIEEFENWSRLAIEHLLAD